MGMPMKRKKHTVARQAAARGPLPELLKELLDRPVKGPVSPPEVQALMLAFNKAIIERATRAPSSGSRYSTNSRLVDVRTS
jgi:putative transposase